MLALDERDGADVRGRTPFMAPAIRPSCGTHVGKNHLPDCAHSNRRSRQRRRALPAASIADQVSPCVLMLALNVSVTGVVAFRISAERAPMAEAVVVSPAASIERRVSQDRLFYSGM